MTNAALRATAILALAAVTATSTVAAPDDPPRKPQRAIDIAALLPASTLAHIELSGEPCQRVGGRLAIARILAEPEMRAFLKPLDQMIPLLRAYADDGLSQMGLELGDILTLARGRASVSLLGLGEDQDGQMMPDIAITVDFSHAKDTGARVLDSLVGMVTKEEPKTVKIGGRTIKIIEFDVGAPLAYAVVDGMVFAGTVPSTIGGMLSRLDGVEDANLTSAANWNAVSGRIRDKNTIVHAWADVGALVSTFGGMMPRESGALMELLGIDAIEAVGYSLALQGNAFRDRFFAYMPERKGIFAKLAPAPQSALVTDGLVPAETVLFGATQIDLSALLTWFADFADAADPNAGDEIRNGIARMSDRLGIDLENDVLKQLGPEVSFYAALPGQALIPDVGLIMKVQDGDRILSTIKKSLAAAGEVPIRTFDYRNTRLHYADLGALGLDWDELPPLKPTWAIVRGHLVVSPWPQAVKNLVRGLDNGTARLTDNPDYKSQLARARENNPAAGNGGVEYMDIRRMVGFILDNGAPFAQSLIPAIPKDALFADAHIEWAAFPSTDVVTRHLFGLFGGTTWTKDGVGTEYTSPTGILPTYALTGAALASVFVAGSADAVPLLEASEPETIEDHMEEEEETGGVPLATRERKGLMDRLLAAKQARARVDMAVLKQACSLFHIKEGRLPKESEWPAFLTEGSTPYITKEAIKNGALKDPWGNPYRYTKSGANAFEIKSLGADGKPGGSGANADISSHPPKKPDDAPGK